MHQPNHSTVFVGRAAELSRLTEFATGTDLASALRIGMLCGDAGIGKSALIEQLIPRLSAKNITVIHAKIYPDSAFSPLLVLAQSLSASAALSKLVENQSVGANVLVPGSLRRIARLRRLVIIIEDTHLMPSEAMEEFSTILTAIANELVAMILATRPGVHPANSIAARWIVEQCPLLGLQAAEVQEYLEQSFGPKVSQEATQILCRTTLGSPLAIQSTVRQLQQQGGQLPSHSSIIERYGKRSAESVAEGFLVRLNNNERSVAARLAILGEVFSKEAAEMIIENSLEWIHRLQQLGVLSRSNITPSPIVGIQSTPPFAFTHTLVHQQLLAFSAVEPDVLCSIIQQAVPLYTTTVLQHIAASSSNNLNQSALESLFDYALRQAEEIAYGPRWLIAADWYDVAEFCLERIGQLGRGIVESTIKLLLTKIYIARPDADVMPTIDTIMSLTSNISSIEIARYRLALFEHCFHWGWKTEDPETHEVLWNEITTIIEIHPPLRYSHDYVGVLFGYKQYVQYAVPNYAFRYELHRRIDVISNISYSLLFDEKSNEYFTTYERITLAKLTFMPIKDVDLTSLFFDWIEKIAPEIEPNSYTQKEYDQLIVLYMEKSGYVIQSLAAANRCIQFCEDHGRLRSVAIMRAQLMFAQLLIGRSPKEIAEEYHVLVEQSKSWAFHVSTRDWGDQLICGFMLRGAIKEAALIIQRHSYSLVNLIIAYLSGDFEWIFSSIENKKINSRMANFIYYSYKGELSNNISCVQQVSDVLNKKIIRYIDILMKICIVDTVQYIRTNHNQHYDMVTSELGDIHAVLNQCLIYFQERQLGACIPPLLDRHKEWFSAKELKHWQSVAENLMNITQKHLSIHADQKIRISMLGTISVTVADKPLHRPQGDRVRSALGLMVANEIFQSKLPIAEFDEIVTGINNDPEHARANMRVVIDRIRKMIGRDAVVTEIGQAPRLHTKIVSVDLLVAAEKIAAATSALQKQRFALAVDSLLAALQIVGTEVPYPTLYDSFFESARQEFEYSLRTAVLATARTLLDVGDDNQAMQILKEAAQSLRGDEEVIELTCNVLERSGKFIEAERLKRDHRILLA